MGRDLAAHRGRSRRRLSFWIPLAPAADAHASGGHELSNDFLRSVGDGARSTGTVVLGETEGNCDRFPRNLLKNPEPDLCVFRSLGRGVYSGSRQADMAADSGSFS